MFKNLIKKLIYPHNYSTEAYVKYIRAGGEREGKIVDSLVPHQYILIVQVYHLFLLAIMLY